MGAQKWKCERKGTLPHAATMIVAWSLQSGRLWKYSCDQHAQTFGGPSYIVARLERLVDNQTNSQPVHPINSPFPPAAVLADIADIADEDATLPDTTAESEGSTEHGLPLMATCVDPECGNTAPYKGAWCHSCQSRWEDEQRAKALRTGRANGRRGF
jgi:hypothetical protein